MLLNPLKFCRLCSFMFCWVILYYSLGAIRKLILTLFLKETLICGFPHKQSALASNNYVFWTLHVIDWKATVDENFKIKLGNLILEFSVLVEKILPFPERQPLLSQLEYSKFILKRINIPHYFFHFPFIEKSGLKVKTNIF